LATVCALPAFNGNAPVAGQCGNFYTYLGRYDKYTGNPNGYFPYPLPDDRKPLPPTPNIQEIISGNTELEVYFTLANGVDILNFQYSLDGGQSFRAFSPPQTTSPLVISGLTNGINYEVSIRAVNSAGIGYASIPVSGMSHG